MLTKAQQVDEVQELTIEIKSDAALKHKQVLTIERLLMSKTSQIYYVEISEILSLGFLCKKFFEDLSNWN